MKETLPLFYLSGGYSVTSGNEKEWVKRTGVKYRCYAYAFVQKGSFNYLGEIAKRMEIDLKLGVKIMMDSSAHSIQKFSTKKGQHHRADEVKDFLLQGYIDFIKERGKDFAFYVNFDYVKHSPTIYAMQKRLEGAGLKPMPMFHGDSGMEWLERYLGEGYQYIGIGSVRNKWDAQRKYYDRVFELVEKYKTSTHDIKVHGFAATNFFAFFGWPWYSVDSSAWAKAAAHGIAVVPHPIKHGFNYIHVSDHYCATVPSSFNGMNKDAQKWIEEQITSRGFDFDKVRTDEKERCTFNAYMYCHAHQFKPKESMYTRWESLL